MGAPVEDAASEDPVEEEAVAEEAAVEEDVIEEAVGESDNDSEVTFQTSPRLSSRLDVASITALMAKNEEGKLSQQEFYRVFLMTVQSGLTANQRLEELETRMAEAEGKINNEPAAPAVAEAPAAEEAPAEEEAAAVEEAAVVEDVPAVEEAASEAVEEVAAVVEESPKEADVAEEEPMTEEVAAPVEEEEEKTEEVDISTLVAVAEKMRPSRKRAQTSQAGRVSQSASRAKRQRRVR